MAGKQARIRAKERRKAKPYDKANSTPAAALGEDGQALYDAGQEANKDDDELELEALLFGKKKRSKNAPIVMPGAGEEDIGELVEDSTLGHLADQELFFTDAPMPEAGPSGSAYAALDDEVEFSDDEDDQQAGDSSSSSDSESDSGSESSSSASSYHSDDFGASRKSQGKKPAWTDPDDGDLEVDIAAQSRLRKLRRTVDEEVVGGRDYEGRLRAQFESLNPRPAWATVARAPASALESLLSSSTSFLSSRKTPGVIPSGQIDIERVRDVEGGDAGVRALAWAPRAGDADGQRDILAVAGGDRRVRIYNIDGPTNALLLAMHLPALPISTLTFHPSRTHILLTGSRPYLQILSLSTSTSARFPILPPNSPVPAPKSLAAVAFSPKGDILAAAGGGGTTYLLAWSEGGPQGLIGTLKTPAGSGKGGDGVQGLYWAKGGEELWTMGGNGGEVTVWNVPQRRCVARWRDQASGGPAGWGEWGARILAGSEEKGTNAIGSSTGIISLYSRSQATSLSGQSLADSSKPPNHLKSFDTITTPITTLCYNPDGQILVAASKDKKDCLKLYHTDSLTAFQNWPTQNTPLGHVTAVGWSPSSEYLAMGNGKGRVLLYRVKLYSGC